MVEAKGSSLYLPGISSSTTWVNHDTWAPATIFYKHPCDNFVIVVVYRLVDEKHAKYLLSGNEHHCSNIPGLPSWWFGSNGNGPDVELKY
jgi:hypothetical protein